MVSAFGLRVPSALPVAMTRSIGKPRSRRYNKKGVYTMKDVLNIIS